MAIAEQFAGLRMDQLIGAPLRAAADAGTQLAHSTASFINEVGFDRDGKVRNVAFGFQRHSSNEDGTSNLEEMKVVMPMLSIVPIPNLQIDEVNILFDMEVKQSERSESTMDMGASLSSSIRFGPVKIDITGSVSAHNSNTRSSDNSAKYHVDVRATNHGMPEGLARVMDMMAANVAPMLVDSHLKDGDGKDLNSDAKKKAEEHKRYRTDMSQLESRISAARGGLDTCIQRLKQMATAQLNLYKSDLNRRLAADDLSDEDRISFGNSLQDLELIYGTFLGQAGDLVQLLADQNEEGSKGGVSDMLGLKGLASDGKALSAYESDAAYYRQVEAAQNSAVQAQKTVSMLEEELYKKKLAYSDSLSGGEKA